MEPFFQEHFDNLVDSPNKTDIWWHSIPLPDGNRINGHHPDKDLQFKMWNAMQIDRVNGLTGKSVLDIGANDGFFTIASLISGAQKVTAIDKDWSTWPHNIEYASKLWQVNPKIITSDFRGYNFNQRFDVILFLGVLYHLEDIFSCMKVLRNLLKKNGVIYLETQMSLISSELPVFEYASDIYPTIAPQDKQSLGGVGISNYLFPNEQAIRNLAFSYDFHCEVLNGPQNVYTKENPTRHIYKFSI